MIKEPISIRIVPVNNKSSKMAVIDDRAKKKGINRKWLTT
jgi:hypothetical protein